MRNAGRYAVLGTAVPCIYPGTLAGLRAAVRHAQMASVRAGPQRLVMDDKGTRVVIQVYELGELTWVASAAEG